MSAARMSPLSVRRRASFTPVTSILGGSGGASLISWVWMLRSGKRGGRVRRRLAARPRARASPILASNPVAAHIIEAGDARQQGRTPEALPGTPCTGAPPLSGNSLLRRGEATTMETVRLTCAPRARTTTPGAGGWSDPPARLRRSPTAVVVVGVCGHERDVAPVGQAGDVDDRQLEAGGQDLPRIRHL